MIKIEDVSKSFRKNKVLDKINLDIQQGDRIALVGSNGAGKTTLIRCLLGEYNHKGALYINKLNPREHRQEVLKQVGFVPQIPPPLKIPVGQLINFAANVYQSNADDIYDICNLLGLNAQNFTKQPFVKLSGGQKQKLLISIALGHKSKLLIMDEPAANLDPEARQSFFKLLADQFTHSAMIISSHRLDEVSALVNRVVELDQGKVVLDDCVMDEGDLKSLLDCRIRISQEEPAFTEIIQQWGFSSTNKTEWIGKVASADRLRFLGLLSRYTGLLLELHLEEQS